MVKSLSHTHTTVFFFDMTRFSLREKGDLEFGSYIYCPKRIPKSAIIIIIIKSHANRYL